MSTAERLLAAGADPVAVDALRAKNMLGEDDLRALAGFTSLELRETLEVPAGSVLPSRFKLPIERVLSARQPAQATPVLAVERIIQAQSVIKMTIPDAGATSIAEEVKEGEGYNEESMGCTQGAQIADEIHSRIEAATLPSRQDPPAPNALRSPPSVEAAKSRVGAQPVFIVA
jgi:hypothetical protein